MSRPAIARRTVAPRAPRRVSGPSRPAAAAAPRTVARPIPARPRVVHAPPAAQRTGALRTVSDHRFLDSLLRSRAWIWILAVGLGGIVAMQVSLLKLNTGISRAVESAATLERQNAELEVQVARLSSDENIRGTALARGLVMPDAGAVRFLEARPDRDAARAAQRMVPPSPEARALVAAGGRVPPGTLAAAPGTAPVQQPAATPQPAATAQPAATPAPEATATPQATPAPTAAATGGQTAPEG